MSDSDSEREEARPGIRLSKEERKHLLAELERSSSRTETAEEMMKRGLQAVKEGNLTNARRLLGQLQQRSPDAAGLNYFEQQLRQAETQHQRKENLRTTEEMLKRYIQQRKKPLAALALDTLGEIAPDHPKLAEYKTWVADLDREVEHQERLEAVLDSTRVALRRGDLATARNSLAQAQRIDPVSVHVEDLATELEAVEQGQVSRAGVERLKAQIETALEQRDADTTERALDLLRGSEVARVTVQTYERRVRDLRQRQADESEAQTTMRKFDSLIADQSWQQARELSVDFGRRFPGDARSTDMFHRVSRLEASQRRQLSRKQGIDTLERFITEGKRSEAQLALRLLRNLDLEPEHLARLEARVAAM